MEVLPTTNSTIKKIRTLDGDSSNARGHTPNIETFNSI
jgi:hypothetical protein